MSTTHGWLEFGLALPAERVDEALVDVVGPVLAAAGTDGLIERGLFLRGFGGPSANTPLTVQVESADPARAGESVAGRLRTALRGDVTVGAARLVPLAGPVFGGPDLAPVTRRFLAGVTPMLVDLVATGRPGPAHRLAGALDLMAAHLPAVTSGAAPGADRAAEALGGAPLSFLSFRSHAEAFLASRGDPPAARHAFDQRYQTVRGQVEDRVAAILARPDEAATIVSAPIVSAPADTWGRAVRSGKPVMTEAFRSGRITAHTEDPDADAAPGSPEPAISEFHAVAGSSGDLQRFLRGDPAFLAVRLLTSLLYLSLHDLGVPLVERYFLCHAVSRACESLFAMDAMTVLTALTAG